MSASTKRPSFDEQALSLVVLDELHELSDSLDMLIGEGQDPEGWYWTAPNRFQLIAIQRIALSGSADTL